MKELFIEQKSENEKAIEGLGEYRLTSAYRSLGMEMKRWFMKTEPQRKSVQGRESGGEECPLPSKDNPLCPTSLPQYTQDSMWDKVQRYLHDSPSYTSAPGVSDKSCVLVQSSPKKWEVEVKV